MADLLVGARLATELGTIQSDRTDCKVQRKRAGDKSDPEALKRLDERITQFDAAEASILADEDYKAYMVDVQLAALPSPGATDAELDLTVKEKGEKVKQAIRNLQSQRLDAEIAATANRHDETLPPHKALDSAIEKQLGPGQRIMCPSCNHAEMVETLGKSIKALKDKYADLLTPPAEVDAK